MATTREVVATVLVFIPFVASAPFLTIQQQLVGVQECSSCFEDKDPEDPQWMALLKNAMDADPNPSNKGRNVGKIVAVRTEELAGTHYEMKFLSNTPTLGALCEARFLVAANSTKVNDLRIKCENDDDGYDDVSSGEIEYKT